MKNEDYFCVGTIVRKYSFKGEVIIKVDKDTPDSIIELESVFIAIGDNLIPFFMEKNLWQKPRQLRVKFEDVDTESDADVLINREVFLSKSFLPKRLGKDFYNAEIIGFKVSDVLYGYVGFIKGVNDKTPQTLLEIIDDSGKLILIPAIDAFIKRIDRERQEVIVETPEGLLDLGTS